MIAPAKPRSPFELVRGLAQRSKKAAERCELCGEPLGISHEHLLNPKTRKLVCSCLPCACLFPADAEGRYKRVPRRVAPLEDFAITEVEWDELAIPIGMAFFFKTGESGGVAAIYPSPAGPVESLLPLSAWSEIESRSDAIQKMEPDVEAVLANRAAQEYFLVPIDECFRLTGLIRKHWRGLSGGTEVWRETSTFFNELRGRSEREAVHA